MKYGALIIGISILISRILGVGREILLAQIAGLGTEKNALDLAFLIPDIVNHLVSTGFLSITFIPVFTGYLVKNQDEDLAWKFFSNVLNILGVILLALLVPAFIWMKPFILLLTSVDPSPEILERAVYFGRIILPAQIFFFVGTFFMSVQYVRQRFLIPSLTGVIYNGAIIFFGWLFANRGLEGFAWGVPIGAGIGFLILQLWGGYKAGARYQLFFDIKNADLKHYILLTLPLMLGVGAMFGLEFVNRSFGSAFGNHGISSLNYAYRMMYTLVAVFGFSVGVAGYPTLARMVKEGKMDILNQTLFNTLDNMIALLLPVLLAVWFNAEALIRVLLERGAFSAQNTELVASLLRSYLPASIALCFQVVLVRCFYAMEKMWLPTLINTGLFALSLPFYLILGKKIGIAAVPLTGALTAFLQVAVLIYAWGKVNSFKGVSTSLKNIIRASIAFIVSLGILWYFESRINDLIPPGTFISSLIRLGSIGILIVLTQSGMQILFGSTSTKMVVAKFIRKIRPQF